MKLKFDMVGIFVSDIEVMVRFYSDVMGLETNWKTGEPYAEFSNDGIRFAMFERAKLPDLLGQEPSYPAGLNGTFELAVNVGSPENVDITFNEMLEKGAAPVYGPRDEPWKMRSAMVSDPEKNLIEIASDFWK